MMQDRGHLLTEARNSGSRAIDTMDVEDAFDVVSAEDATIAAAVAVAKPSICAAVRVVTDALSRGGRLFYVGAGTSGRLGVLDAAECPPTFLTDPAMIQGIIAGGYEALHRSIEGAEDHAQDGVAAIDGKSIGRGDVVIGIATGGTTPFVHGAIQRARECGAGTVFLACVPADQVSDHADVSIRVLTGPEVITGSTRMKAGTATKMVLNMISTLTMVGLGKVYQNLMVDVNTRACAKLVDRGVRVLTDVLGIPRSDASALLERADGNVKSAIVMHWCGVDQYEARRRLASCGGRIRPVIAAAE
ncbi:MAG: N-acetylmuramic acid 6-phosphate etherase [Phycisphaerales bacterium]|nr:N-acetylmuramic acid 6-phosphate etherase [Phycisphaerales bacterium]